MHAAEQLEPALSGTVMWAKAPHALKNQLLELVLEHARIGAYTTLACSGNGDGGSYGDRPRWIGVGHSLAPIKRPISLPRYLIS